MNLAQATFLGVIQGLTEFLPVSSSGHLAIFQHLFGLVPPVEFDIFVHLGTLVAVIWFFRIRLVRLWQTRLEKKTRNYLGMILVGSLPAILIGLFLKPRLDFLFGSLEVVSFGLLTTGLMLFFGGRKRKKKNQHPLGVGGALRVGLAQALALIPGVSRSGSTISAGLRIGLSRQTAFELSFLLAIPATAGAVVLSFPELLVADGQLVNAFIGMVVSGLVGFLALGWLEKVLAKGKLRLFGTYCLFLAILIALTI